MHARRAFHTAAIGIANVAVIPALRSMRRGCRLNPRSSVRLTPENAAGPNSGPRQWVHRRLPCQTCSTSFRPESIDSDGHLASRMAVTVSKDKTSASLRLITVLLATVVNYLTFHFGRPPLDLHGPAAVIAAAALAMLVVLVVLAAQASGGVAFGLLFGLVCTGNLVTSGLNNLPPGVVGGFLVGTGLAGLIGVGAIGVYLCFSEWSILGVPLSAALGFLPHRVASISASLTVEQWLGFGGGVIVCVAFAVWASRLEAF